MMVFITAIMLMMLVCGCRTRITNNTEVGNMITDDSGMLQDSYQTRRDELGIPVAEAPLFKGTSSDEEDIEYDDYEEYNDWSEEDSEEDDEESEEPDDEIDTNRNTTTTTRPGTSTRPGTTVTPAKRPSHTVKRRPSPSQTTTVKVTFNVNGKGATCSRSSTIVKKGSIYGPLPSATRSGYDFEGWYTDKTGGSKVTSKSKLVKDKDHTLYAHWKETEKKSYRITFNGNGEDDEVELSSSETTVNEGGTYGDLPSAKREKYNFQGWFTDPEKGSQITSGTKFTANKDQTLYAHWEYDAYKWWDDEFKKAANEIDEESKLSCLIEDAGDNAESFMDDCRVNVTDNETDSAYVIKFIDNFGENAGQEAADLSEKYPDKTVIVVDSHALDGGKEEMLFCKMAMLETIYEIGNNIGEAGTDLLKDNKTVDNYIFQFSPNN